MKQVRYFDQHSKHLSELKSGDLVRMKLPGKTQWSQAVVTSKFASHSYKGEANGKAYGVHDCLIRWIKVFLCDRQQRVRIDGILSPSISPRGGIPQGTRLAPLLLAVLVNRRAED